MSIYVDIKKSWADFSLNVQLEAENEIMGLLGASGCGKSMTLKCIAGIIQPDQGKIILNGQILFDSDKNINLPPQVRRTGYLFQNYALFPHMTVVENIAAGLRCGKTEKGQVVARMMEAFRLSGLEKHYPGQLSGGQQQRVALARIFASDPDIIMLDEPFTALDNHLKWQIELETMRFLEQYEKPILFVSHSRDEVYRLCDRIAVLSAGRLESVSDKQAMFTAPQTLAASRLTGCKNHSRAEKLGPHTLRALDWNCVLQTQAEIPAGLSHVGIRAHYIQPAVPSEQKQNQLDCEVVRVIEDVFSVMVLVRVKHGCGEAAEIVWQLGKDDWQAQGEQLLEVCLALPPERLLLLC